MGLNHYLLKHPLAPEILVLGVCVLLVAAVLTQFTRPGGVMGFAINSVLLFGSAMAAEYLTRDMQLPMYFIFVHRFLLVYFGGMLVCSLLLLLLFPRAHRE